MNNNYYYKYIKYKEKYSQLLNQINTNNTNYIMDGGTDKNEPNYYLTHSPFKLKNLLAILSEGIIKLGKDLSEDTRVFGGYEPLEYIYANIYWDDIKNMSHLLNYAIILDSKIIKDFNIIVNENWGGKILTKLNKSDSKILREKKLEKIKNFLKNPKSLPDILLEKNMGFHHHELLFNTPINIKKYIKGISCPNCTDKIYNKIKKTLDSNGYKNVKIFQTNIPPSIAELN